MAKRGGDDSGYEKGKIRIFFAEVEGNNQSLQDALKTVVAAMSRPGQLTAVRIPAATQNTLAAQTDAGVVSEQAGVEVADEETAVEAEQSPAPARRRGTGPKADRNAGIKLVPNLDFRPSGKPALKQFFADKGPKTDMEQCLVIGYYMQHVLELPTFSPSVVFRM